MKLYIAVLDEFPAYMTPTLVGHAVLGHHCEIDRSASPKRFEDYKKYLETSFKKVTVKVNQKEFDKIVALDGSFTCWENNTLDGKPSCSVWLWNGVDPLPNVLKFAKLWTP